ncbi:MAG: hypothetical protein HY319_24545 [Armatimonadetes bacterium]|nr:hypothetical protein [Armatimonadota bacterium]
MNIWKIVTAACLSLILAPPPVAAGPAPTPQAPQGAIAGDWTTFSPEVQENGGPAPNKLLGGLRDSFGPSPPADGEDLGPKELVNPSAVVEQDCADILSALGLAPPQDLNLATRVTAVPVKNQPGVLIPTSSSGHTQSQQGPGLMQKLKADIAQAKATYRDGSLPPKVEALVQHPVSAAARAGMPNH